MAKIKFIGILMVFLGFSGCFEKDIFPDTPNISFVDLTFIEGERTGSFNLTFQFEDGEANIGLLPDDDILPPFHEIEVFIDARDSLITFANLENAIPPIYTAPLITRLWVPLRISGNTLFIEDTNNDFPIFGFDRVLFSDDPDDIPTTCPNLSNQRGEYDTLTFTTYRIDSENNVFPTTGAQVVEGEIPINKVETHSNIIIEFQRRVGDEFVPLDYQSIFNTSICSIGDFDGRIPLFDSEGTSGTITYSIQSQLFRLAFGDDEIRLKFYVYDRSGNQSNVEFSPSFFFSDISQ